MSLSRVKVWQAGDVLTAADLNAEFNNVLNNGQSLVQPWVGTFDLDGNTLVLDGDADTSIDCATDDTIDITIAGADDFRFTANTLTALSGSSIAVTNGNITSTAGNLTITDGSTSLADADTRTDTVATPLTISAETSGTPAAGIGTGILFRAESADEAPSNVGQAEFALSTVTAGAEVSYFQVLTRYAGAALSSAYRFARGANFNAIFTHTLTADRTYTLPDITDTIVTRTNTDTLTNKTLSGAVVTGAAPATPTANGLYTDSLVKGFVKFQVNGTIDTDLNVSSITDTGTGDWTINWATAFASANYVVTTGLTDIAPNVRVDATPDTFVPLGLRVGALATGTCRIVHYDAQFGTSPATAVLTDPDGPMFVQAVGLQ